MTYYDWSTSDPCCMQLEGDEYVCPSSCAADECLVNCDAFFRSRMPKTYDMIDVFICLVYLVNYIL